MKKIEKNDSEMAMGRKNYIYMGISVLIVVIGFALMSEVKVHHQTSLMKRCSASDVSRYQFFLCYLAFLLWFML